MLETAHKPKDLRATHADGLDFFCEIKRDDLLRVLSGIQGAVNRKSANTVLTNILLEITDGKLTVVGTSIDISIVNCIPIIDGYGIVTVMCSMLFDICRKLAASNTVVLRKLENRDILELMSGNASFQLPTIDHEKFPKIDINHDDSDAIEISCDVCFKLFDKVSFAMANDEARQYLCGTNMTLGENGTLSLVATNGHRLAMITLKTPENSNLAKTSIIIPKRAIFEVMKHALISPKDFVRVLVQHNRIVFSFPQTKIISKLIDGQYPDVARVVPKEETPRCSVQSSAFIGVLERVSAVLLDKSNGVSLNLRKGQMAVSSRALEYGSAASENIAIDYDGPEIEVTLNAKYLIEVVTKCEGQDFCFFASSPDKPVLCINEQYPGFLCVIMPMRV